MVGLKMYGGEYLFDNNESIPDNNISRLVAYTALHKSNDADKKDISHYIF